MGASEGTTPRKSESRRERFKRLAEARTKSVLSKVKVLGNCANRSAYDYTADDVKKIFKAIRERISEVESKFSGTSDTDEFKL
jgi:hypothetical protein